jgi:hypothetical protein
VHHKIDNFLCVRGQSKMGITKGTKFSLGGVPITN